MTGLRRTIAALLAVVAMLFPATAIAWPGEGIWNDVKDVVGETIDSAFGALEVGWEGVYGFGCGVKNLATWNGESCGTSVSDAGDSFRSLLRDVDDCASNLDPIGITGLGTETTAGNDTLAEAEIGMSASEVEKILNAATGDLSAAQGTAAFVGAATGADKAASKYLASRGGIRAIAKNPAWAKVVRGLPVVRYLALAYAISETCSSTLEFVVFGTDYLVTGQEVWRQNDKGTWLHCTVTCVPDPELNYPGCEPIFVQRESGEGEELVCYPHTGPPGPAPTADEALRDVVCPPMIRSADSTFDSRAHCDGLMREAAAACRNGTSRFAASTCAQLTRTTRVATESGGGSTGARTAPNRLDPRSVPGGSVEGTCASIIRLAASGGGPIHPNELTECLGTADPTCQELRAKAAAGHAVFPMAPALQERCFT